MSEGEEGIRGAIASLFFSSDTPTRQVLSYEAVPRPDQIPFDCGKCGVRINKDWNSSGYAYCNNGHLNHRTTDSPPKWNGEQR